MKRLDAPLITPIYVKTGPQQAWPRETACYILAGNDLFLARRHEFFQSCVSAPRWPAELAPQDSFFRPNYPKVPQRKLECVVGFFDRAYQLRGAESVALLAWDPVSARVRVIVPEQVATSRRNYWGDAFPISVRYNFAACLPGHLTVFGDIHSHCDMAAFASGIDQDDEQYGTGMLHIIVGKLQHEPPQFHIEAVVDRTRFQVAPELVLDGYFRRNGRFPRSWMRKLEVKYFGPGACRRSPAHPNTASTLQAGNGSGSPGGERRPGDSWNERARRPAPGADSRTGDDRPQAALDAPDAKDEEPHDKQ